MYFDVYPYVMDKVKLLVYADVCITCNAQTQVHVGDVGIYDMLKSQCIQNKCRRSLLRR